MFNKFSIKNLNVEGLDKIGIDDFYIDAVSDLNSTKNNSIIFISNWEDRLIIKLNSLINCLIILPKINDNVKLEDIKKNNLIIFSDNPRLRYAVILNSILDSISSLDGYVNQDGYTIGKNVTIGNNSKIYPQVFIDNNVTIGNHCTIYPGAKIRENVIIGDNSIIRENSVIGGQGFGIEKNKDFKNIKIPHLGGVKIGKHVEIGALTTIVSGTINPTIIEDYVKIDDHVHLAHNCIIKSACIITACSEISGSVTINSNSWLGPNCSIMQKVTIGEGSIVGLGAVVTKSFNKGSILVGNPAITMQNYKKNK